MTRNIRLLTIITCGIVYFFIATQFRILGLANEWPELIMIFLGAVPSFLAVLALTNLFVFFYQKRDVIQLLWMVGATLFGIEILSSFQTTGETGTSFDYYDLLAIIIGLVFTYFIEQKASVTGQ